MSPVDEIMELIKHLKPDEQSRVLKLVRELAGEKKCGLPGARLLAFAGHIEDESLKEMQRAIEEACETISLDEW